MILGWIPYLKEKSTMKNWLITVDNTDIIYLLVFQMFYWLHIYWSWLSPVLFLLHACMHTQSFPTLCNPMDCSLPGCSVYGIFQARILEWVANSFSRGSSWPKDWTQISHIVSRCFTLWATREVLWSCMGRGKVIPACHLFLTQLVEGEVGWDRDGRQGPCCFSRECWLSLKLWRRKN